jgi:hypothetical protein
MFSEEFFGNIFSLIWGINYFNTTLESSLFNISHTSSTSQDLGLDYASIFEFTGNFECFLIGEGNITKWNSNIERMKEGTGLVLMELDTTGLNLSEHAVDLCALHESTLPLELLSYDFKHFNRR